MSFDVDKCVVVSVITPQENSNYTLYGRILSIDSELYFNQHVDNSYICKKALGFVKRNFKTCSHKVKKDLYFTCIKPVLEYAAAVWAPHTRCSINKLESIQRHAARFVMNDCRPVVYLINWTTTETHFKHLRLQMLHKIAYNHVDVSLPNYVTYKSRHI